MDVLASDLLLRLCLSFNNKKVSICTTHHLWTFYLQSRAKQSLSFVTSFYHGATLSHSEVGALLTGRYFV